MSDYDDLINAFEQELKNKPNKNDDQIKEEVDFNIDHEIAESTRSRITDDNDTYDKIKKTVFILDANNIIHPISWDICLDDSEAVRNAIKSACTSNLNNKVKLQELLELTTTNYLAYSDEKMYERDKELAYVTINNKKQYFKNGQILDYDNFEKLADNGFYMVINSTEIGNSIGEDQNVYKNPLENEVIQSYILTMAEGDYLIKHSYFDLPHYRYFVLSTDLKRIIWYTTSKLSRGYICLCDIEQITVGNSAFRFKEPLEYNPYAITIVTNYEKINVSFINYSQFTCWVNGIRALICFWKRIIFTDDQLSSTENLYENKNINVIPIKLTYTNIEIKKILNTTHKLIEKYSNLVNDFSLNMTKFDSSCDDNNNCIINDSKYNIPNNINNDEYGMRTKKHEICYDIPQKLQTKLLNDKMLSLDILKKFINNIRSQLITIENNINNISFDEHYRYQLISKLIVDIETATDIAHFLKNGRNTIYYSITNLVKTVKKQYYA